MKSRETKREQAEQRNAAWAALSREAKLAYLDKHFPKGATRQRARLAAQQ